MFRVREQADRNHSCFSLSVCTSLSLSLCVCGCCTPLASCIGVTGHDVTKYFCAFLVPVSLPSCLLVLPFPLSLNSFPSVSPSHLRGWVGVSYCRWFLVDVDAKVAFAGFLLSAA